MDPHNRFDGYFGSVECLPDAIVISHTGPAFGTVPPRRIPLSAIVGVHFSPATRLMNGFVQVRLRDSAPEPVPKMQAASHPDCVSFVHRDNDRFAELARWLDSVGAWARAQPTNEAVEAAGPPDRGRAQRIEDRLVEVWKVRNDSAVQKSKERSDELTAERHARRQERTDRAAAERAIRERERTARVEGLQASRDRNTAAVAAAEALAARSVADRRARMAETGFLQLTPYRDHRD